MTTKKKPVFRQDNGSMESCVHGNFTMIGKLKKKMTSSPKQMLNHQEVRRISRFESKKQDRNLESHMYILYTGKFANVKKIKRLQVDTLGINVVRWANNGLYYNRTIFYYSDANQT